MHALQNLIALIEDPPWQVAGRLEPELGFADSPTSLMSYHYHS